MRIIWPILIVIVLLQGESIAQTKTPRFEDYKVRLYHGKIHKPKWIRHIKGNEWRDNLGKLVGPPEVDFAGKYCLYAHSLGTGSRYYTLTDLSTGRELDIVGQFTTAEPPPITRDGREYLTILYNQPNSRMLVAQYLFDILSEHPTCRERVFVFDDKRIKSITKTRPVCTKF